MLRQKEIGQLFLGVFFILNTAEPRNIRYGDEVGDGITSAGQDYTKYNYPLTSLLGENRFDYHMFGCNCHPVMDCIHDSDCHRSKGQDYYCEFRCCAFKCVADSDSNDEAVVDTVSSTEPAFVQDTNVITSVIPDENHDEKDAENHSAETHGNHSEPDSIPVVFNVVHKLPDDSVAKDVYDVNITIPTDSFSNTDIESVNADVDKANEGITSNGKYPVAYDYNADISIGKRDQKLITKTKDNIDEPTANTDKVHNQSTKKDPDDEIVDKTITENEGNGTVKKTNA